MVNYALKTVGMPYDEKKMQEAFGVIESCYLGDGWYSDGVTLQRDYYISFAMHFYALIYAKLEPAEEQSKVYLERARLFAQDYE